MRINGIVLAGQSVLIILALFLVSCFPNTGTGEIVVMPPATPPLSRQSLGYGVISASYTHVVAEPNQAGLSLGYLRRGSIVEVLERRSLNRGETAESWVFVAGAYRGWLREDVIQVYDNEARAKTAAESFSQ
jgi:hypothetical protein